MNNFETSKATTLQALASLLASLQPPNSPAWTERPKPLLIDVPTVGVLAFRVYAPVERSGSNEPYVSFHTHDDTDDNKRDTERVFTLNGVDYRDLGGDVKRNPWNGEGTHVSTRFYRVQGVGQWNADNAPTDKACSIVKTLIQGACDQAWTQLSPSFDEATQRALYERMMYRVAECERDVDALSMPGPRKVYA